MTARRDRSYRYKASATAALLFGLSCTSAFASSGIKSDCAEVSDALPAVAVPAPSLVLKLIDYGQTKPAADMKAPASDPAEEKVSSPALADVEEVNLSETEETASSDADPTAAVDDLPETALRLPGVSEKELPRFRRQMYRTDI